MKRKLAFMAVAACSFAITASDAVSTIQIFPAGRFLPQDGRPLTVPGWKIEAASAARVIEKFNAKKTPLVIDYEHQTLAKANNGQPAPAAAWFKSLEWREGLGMFAEVEFTPKALEAIANNEYKFFSPVFSYDDKTGEVLSLVMGALTNTPAIDGMEEMTLRAAACFGGSTEDDNMPLLAQLLTLLSLAPETNEADAIAALSARLDANSIAPLCKALGLGEDTSTETLVAACSALQTKAAAGEPDPSKYVPVSTLTAVQGEMAALSQRLNARDADDLNGAIESALEDGRLTKGMESWARELGKSNIEALNQYLDSAKPLSALLASQTHGKQPNGADLPEGVTAEELAVCSQIGIDPKDYLAAKGTSAAA